MSKPSKFNIEYYYPFYLDLVSYTKSDINNFLSKLSKKSIRCLYSIQESYFKSIEGTLENINDFFLYSNDFSWYTAFYLRRKFNNFKRSFNL